MLTDEQLAAREQEYQQVLANGRGDLGGSPEEHYAYHALELIDEIKRLKAGDFTPEEFQTLCHNMTGADAGLFAAGCAEYMRKLFGRCPVVDRDGVAAYLDDLAAVATGDAGSALESAANSIRKGKPC